MKYCTHKLSIREVIYPFIAYIQQYLLRPFSFQDYLNVSVGANYGMGTYSPINYLLGKSEIINLIVVISGSKYIYM